MYKTRDRKGKTDAGNWIPKRRVTNHFEADMERMKGGKDYQKRNKGETFTVKKPITYAITIGGSSVLVTLW